MYSCVYIYITFIYLYLHFVIYTYILSFILTFIHGVTCLLQNKSVVTRHQVRGRVKASDWWINSITHEVGSTSRSSSLRSRGILLYRLIVRYCKMWYHPILSKYRASITNTDLFTFMSGKALPHNLWSECIINMNIWMIFFLEFSWSLNDFSFN